MAAVLIEELIPEDPFELFATWLEEAEATGMTDPNAVTVATAGADGRPSARTVLLRGFGSDGFYFYTNRTSLKGRQLAENPRAEMLFFWREMGRQVLIHGEVTEAPEADSDAYFASRARESQIGAWASEQGTIIPDRAALEERVAHFTAKFEGGPVPRPPHWGGYIVAPYAIEFWQAGDFRLHDRFVYAREGHGWTVERLSP